MKMLENMTAIVTGASVPRGIGYATALSLAEQGANLVVTDRADAHQDNLAKLQQLVDEIKDKESQAMALLVDITDRQQIDACVAATLERFGRIDILFNNAGTTIGAVPFLELTASQLDISYEVNLKGTAEFCQAVIPVMIEQGGGSIINNVSTAGLGADPYFGAYTATKHAVIGLTKTIAAEFGPHNIRCNAVCPGFVNTDMHLQANERLAKLEKLSTDEIKSRRYQAVALRRAAEPEEVASTVVYLSSQAASYVTGVAIPVAGGSSVGL